MIGVSRVVEVILRFCVRQTLGGVVLGLEGTFSLVSSVTASCCRHVGFSCDILVKHIAQMTKSFLNRVCQSPLDFRNAEPRNMSVLDESRPNLMHAIRTQRF